MEANRGGAVKLKYVARRLREVAGHLRSDAKALREEGIPGPVEIARARALEEDAEVLEMLAEMLERGEVSE